MTYYKKREYLESDDDEWDILVKHAIISITEDSKHDANAVFEFENRALKILQEEVGPEIKVHKWTDGCAVSLRKTPKITRIFFETSHGKNVSDGLGEIVEKLLLSGSSKQ